MHLIITDSGLGGLSICAGLDRALGNTARVRLTYVNAWPEQGRGYNDLPDMAARAAVFDRALAGMAAMRPDGILIACNTLSVVYDQTAFRKAPRVPVRGIIDSGVQMFDDALTQNPPGALVIVGTRTTVESGVYRRRLIDRGLAATRIASASCHGLAAAIERGPENDATATLIDACAASASVVAPAGEPLFLGLACTHYGMIGERLAGALAARTGRKVVALDPNAWMISDVLARIPPDAAGDAPREIEVVSKVELTEAQREAIARLLEGTSAGTAAALRGYRHVPDLF